MLGLVVGLGVGLGLELRFALKLQLGLGSLVASCSVQEDGRLKLYGEFMIV